ncbi:MAG: SGNH/GDSL hydrolase family protein [Dermatophilaceae bacterium]
MNRIASRRRIVAATISLATATAAAAALGVPAAAAATSTDYVALGDSYSSGTGTRSYLNDGTSCQRSLYAYPALDAGALGLSLTFRACSGATVADVTSAQLSALTTSTDYVTISVGGNDAGFASVLTTCALPGWMSNCNRAVDGAQNIINNTLPGRLATLYSSIASKAPNAQVIVVGYPRIFNGQDCNALTWFSSSEETRLNATADLLNAKTASAAAAKGFTFVNPTSSFIGHAVCDRTEWINGLSNPITESYHPNRTGQASGYAALTKPEFSVPVSQAAKAKKISAASLAKSAAQYRSLDAAITPKEFIAPDLSTPAAKAAAKAAGVDLNSRASIDRADRLATAAQDRAQVFAR